ncbi:hypothetical protein SteCoe_37505 [Stentor coeruleus]|uniref:Uncharacterized protein n=1 Tax=Stentor coeruleus TaxID=5963 RepID=A0A1R2AMW8_9CILI|nr:hypothetical protein SteCoe_37505 [Stentor coeruleus]
MEELIKRVEELEKNTQKSSRERELLLNRICELEDLVEDLTLQLKKSKKTIRTPVAPKESLAINNASKKTNAQEDEPWLFYCPKNKPYEEILRNLDFSEGYEITSSALVSEEALWTQILEKMNEEEIPKKLTALRKLVSVQLSSACHHELLIIVRGIPGNENPLFQLILPHIATLAEYVNIAWSEVENSNPELLGRIALVLECEQDLKVLSVDRGDTRLSLYVEKLL